MLIGVNNLPSDNPGTKLHYLLTWMEAAMPGTRIVVVAPLPSVRRTSALLLQEYRPMLKRHPAVMLSLCGQDFNPARQGAQRRLPCRGEPWGCACCCLLPPAAAAIASGCKESGSAMLGQLLVCQWRLPISPLRRSTALFKDGLHLQAAGYERYWACLKPQLTALREASRAARKKGMSR